MNNTSKFDEWIMDQDFIRCLHNEEYYKQIIKDADRIKAKYKHFVVIGMGGSFSAAKSIIDLLPNNGNIDFIYCMDKTVVDSVLSRCSEGTLFIVITKSGSTIEVLSITQYLIQKGYNSFFCITDSSVNGNKVLKLLGSSSVEVFEYKSSISGRFSFTTNVAMIVLQIANIDINQVRMGFIDGYNEECDIDFCNYMMSEAAHNIIMPYSKAFESFNNWYAQIFAESLCTEGVFDVLPITSIGTIDQHSVLEGYLANPKGKFVTFIDSQGQDHTSIDMRIITNEDFPRFKSLTEIKSCEMNSTILTCSERGLKNRYITIKRSPFDLAKLMMKLTVEILFISYQAQINPFNQNMVELRKKNGIKALMA